MCLLITSNAADTKNCFLLNRKKFFRCNRKVTEISLLSLCMCFISFALLYIFGGNAKVEKSAFVVGNVCIREVRLYCLSCIMQD